MENNLNYAREYIINNIQRREDFIVECMEKIKNTVNTNDYPHAISAADRIRYEVNRIEEFEKNIKELRAQLSLVEFLEKGSVNNVKSNK